MPSTRTQSVYVLLTPRGKESLALAAAYLGQSIGLLVRDRLTSGGRLSSYASAGSALPLRAEHDPEVRKVRVHVKLPSLTKDLIERAAQIKACSEGRVIRDILDNDEMLAIYAEARRQELARRGFTIEALEARKPERLVDFPGPAQAVIDYDDLVKPHRDL